MADDQANEPFNLDNDFEGGRWVGGEGGEFMYDGEKKKRKMSKEEAIYGSFLEGMKGFGGGSDSDEDDNSKGRKKKSSGFTLKGNAAATGAPRFVSSGKYLQGDKKEEIADSDEDSPAEVSTAKSGRFRDAMQKRDSRQHAPKSFGRQAGTQRSASGRSGPAAEVANWEKHTKGIGSKLLSKMGWSGGGLGAEGSGIAKPIEVTLRPKNAGLGVNGIDKRQPDTRAQPPRDERAATAAVVTDDMDLEQLWKRGSQKSKKVVFQTTAPGSAPQQAQPHVPDAPKQVIIDMSGKDGPRVVTQLADALRKDEPTAAGARGAARRQFLPELGHNVKMLADLAEIGVQNIERKMQQDRENMARLERESARLDQLLALEAKQLERLEDMQAIIHKCRQRLSSVDNPLTLEGLAKVFDMLQQKYPEEYFVFNLSTLAFAMVGPALKQRVDSWKPEKQPTPADLIATFRTWRTLLCRAETPGQDVFEKQEAPSLKAAENDQYLRLVCEIVLPKIRSFLASQWDPRLLCVLAVDLLRAWEEVLPPAALRSLLATSVLPKLKLEVDKWNPMTDTVPIHVWLHPWLPMLGTAMEPLYIPIRQKLTRILQLWQPDDPSAHALLLPWKDVWDEAGMSRLLSATIEPKLAETLSKHFVVNPADQNLAPLLHVLNWRDMLPTAKLATLLEVFFFPKWLQALHSWLIGSPNFEEVTQWYLGWKELLPEEVLDQPRIKALLGHALDMMNRALSGQLSYQMPPLPVPGAVAPQQPAIVIAPRPSTLPGNEPSFKEVMQRFAQDNNFLFLPGKRAHPAGKPTYQFGRVDVTLDKDIIYAYDKGKWGPVTLEELVAMAKRFV